MLILNHYTSLTPKPGTGLDPCTTSAWSTPPDDKAIKDDRLPGQHSLCSGCRCTAQLNRKPELPERMEAPGMLAPWPEFVVHSHQPLQLLPCRGGQQFMLLHTPWASSAVWSPGWPLPTWDYGGLCLTSSQADSWRRTHPDSRDWVGQSIVSCLALQMGERAGHSCSAMASE